MHPTKSTTSRLRKSGLTRTAAAAAIVAVAASTALVTANAAIVYSGVLNTTASSPPSGPQNSVTIPVNVDNFGTAEFSLRAIYNTKASFDQITSFNNGFQPIADSATGGKITKFGLGQPVDAADIFSTGSSYGNSASFYSSDTPSVSAWAANDDGYFGFTFNPTSGTPLYGWAEIVTSANGSTVKLVDYAYDDAGASILTGAGRPAPEPSTAVLGGLGLLGLAGFLGRRRRRTAARA